MLTVGVETFKTTIVEADRGGAYVRVPAAVVTALGGKGRIPVRATFDGIEYDGSIVSMGDEKVLGVLKAIRTQLGKAPGDAVTVTVTRDGRTRTVEVPEDLQAALAAAGLEGTFSALSYSHQREYILWITEAKKPATRVRRVSETITRIRA